MFQVVSLLFALVPNVSSCASGSFAAPESAQFEAERSGWRGSGGELDPVMVETGRGIAERECISCHAIDATSTSRNLSAPPLREVLLLNDPEFLAYRFIDAMRIGHDTMPLFDFDVRTADSLIAYIESINDTR